MKKRGPSMKTYHGHHYGAGVEVEETVRGPGFEMKRQRRPLDPRLDLANHSPSGFAWGDGKFRFKPDWPNVPFPSPWFAGPVDRMPKMPDHWNIIEDTDEKHPFRLVTSPARNFLNSSFTETATSRKRECRPEVMIHPTDAAALDIADGSQVALGNSRGEVRLHARLFAGVRRGVLIAESIWPNAAFADERGINTLIGGDPIPPYGGAAFHDNRVWIRSFHAAIYKRNADHVLQ